MTTISEIARAADVSVESVLRVLNRDKVSPDVESRVVSAMDAYGYSRLPRPETFERGNSTAPPTPESTPAPPPARPSPRTVVGEVVDDNGTLNLDAEDAIGRAREQLLHAVGDVVNELENPEALTRASNPGGMHAQADRIRVIDARLDRVARDLDTMKRELARTRSEQLDDLRLLVDLITTSWRSADRRLARIDRKLERMEGFPQSSRGVGNLPRARER